MKHRMRLFKVLSPEGKSIHGGHYTWKLPRKNRPGAWTRPIKELLKPCVIGYHLAPYHSTMDWLDCDTLHVYEAEADKLIKHESLTRKYVTNKARLLRLVGTWTPEKYRNWRLQLLDEIAQKHGLPLSFVADVRKWITSQDPRLGFNASYHIQILINQSLPSKIRCRAWAFSQLGNQQHTSSHFLVMTHELLGWNRCQYSHRLWRVLREGVT